jgi:hypothetical protein
MKAHRPIGGAGQPPAGSSGSDRGRADVGPSFESVLGEKTSAAELPLEGKPRAEKPRRRPTGTVTGGSAAQLEADRSAVATEVHVPVRTLGARTAANKEPTRGGRHAREEGEGDKQKPPEPEVPPPRRVQRPSKLLAPLALAATTVTPPRADRDHGHAERAAIGLPGWNHAGPPTADPGVLPAPTPLHALPLLAEAKEDPGLRATVHPSAAHLTLASSEGDLSLHLRIKDGNAEVRIGGSLAPMFEARAAEIQAVLASEGLNLGRFDLDQGGARDQAPREPADDSAPTRPKASASTDTPKPPGHRRGRIHVKA